MSDLFGNHIVGFPTRGLLRFGAKIRSAYPRLTIYTWGLRGYPLHGHVFLMWKKITGVSNQTKFLMLYIIIVQSVSFFRFMLSPIPEVKNTLEQKVKAAEAKIKTIEVNF